MEKEAFNFYQHMKMQGDPLWIDVTGLMIKDSKGISEFASEILNKPEHASKLGDYVGRLSTLLCTTPGSR